jgi:hypothetical protein
VAFEHGSQQELALQIHASDTNWTDVTTASSSNFTGGGKYLILCKAQIGGGDSREFLFRLVHGTVPTVFNGSSVTLEPSDNNPTDFHCYGYMAVFTQPSTSEDISFQFRTTRAGKPVKADEIIIAWLRLDSLTENTDYFYVEDDDSSSPVAVGTSPTYVGFASKTFTPNIADQKWMVLANPTYQVNSTEESVLFRINQDSGAETTPEFKQEGADTQEQLSFLLHRGYTLDGEPAASHTFTIEGAQESGGTLADHHSSRLFILRLDAFQDADYFWASGDTGSLDATGGFTEIGNIDITALSTLDFFLLSYASYNASATGDKGKMRIQADGATTPPQAPFVRSVTESDTFSESTSHDVAMPATVVGGELLLTLFANDGTATVTTPSGWTALGTNATIADRTSVYAKVANGTEGGTTVDFITSASEVASAQVWRVAGWPQDIASVELSTFTSGIDTVPNPPSFSPSWGAKDTLWIALTGLGNGSSTVSSYPTNYTGGLLTMTIGAAETSGVAAASRQLSTSTEDPGAFTLGVSDSWSAAVVAVEPAGVNTQTISNETDDENPSFNVAVLNLAIGARDLDLDGGAASGDTITAGDRSFIVFSMDSAGGQAEIGGVGALAAVGRRTRRSPGVLSGVGSIAARSTLAHSAATVSTGVANIGAIGTQIFAGAGAQAGVGTLAPKATVTQVVAVPVAPVKIAGLVPAASVTGTVVMPVPPAVVRIQAIRPITPVLYTITPEGPFAQDAYLESAAASTRHGLEGTMVFGDENTNPRRAVIELPLRGIRPGATVTAATLTLTTITSPASPFTATCDRLIRYNWDSASVTWNAFREGAPWTVAGGDIARDPVSFTFTVPSSGNVEISAAGLVTMIQDALDKRAGRLLLRLKGPAAGTETVTVASGQNIDLAKSPTLKVTTTETDLGHFYLGMKRIASGWVASNSQRVTHIAIGIGNNTEQGWKERRRLQEEIYRKPVIGTTLDGFTGDVWSYFAAGEGTGEITEVGLFASDSTAVLDACETTTGWTGTDWTFSVSTTAKEGAKSLKAISGTVSNSNAIIKSLSVRSAASLDDYLQFWIRTDQGSAVSFSLVLTDDVGTWTWSGLTAPPSASWKHYMLRFGDATIAPAQTGPGLITSLAFTIAGTGTPIYLIDHIRIISGNEEILAWAAPPGGGSLTKALTDQKKIRFRLGAKRGTNG